MSEFSFPPLTGNVWFRVLEKLFPSPYPNLEMTKDYQLTEHLLTSCFLIRIPNLRLSRVVLRVCY